MKNKGKGISTKPTADEKKVVVEKEMEWQRQIQSILRQLENDPHGLDKGYPSKHYCYENIEALVVTREMHDFEKIPKKSYATENTDFNQLDFPNNKMMFMAKQYQIVEKFKDKEEFKWLTFDFMPFLEKENVE